MLNEKEFDLLKEVLGDETSKPKQSRKLGIYRIHHKDQDIKSSHTVGAIVIAKEVIVGGKPDKGQRYYVTVDGIKFLDFCGASFICYLDDKESEKILSRIKEDVLDYANI